MIDESYTQRMWNDYMRQVKELKEKGLTEQEIASSMNSSPLLVENLLKKLKEKQDERTN
jgi:orotate phosphoribosyltransferase-like protein